jgi:hypothetical protein
VSGAYSTEPLVSRSSDLHVFQPFQGGSGRCAGVAVRPGGRHALCVSYRFVFADLLSRPTASAASGQLLIYTQWVFANMPKGGLVNTVMIDLGRAARVHPECILAGNLRTGD